MVLRKGTLQEMCTEVFNGCGGCTSPVSCTSYGGCLDSVSTGHTVVNNKPYGGMVGGIYVAIANERRRAHAKHVAKGNSAEDQDWSWYRWTPVLVEELGEAAEALQDTFDADPENFAAALVHMKVELVQVAAMAAAWADSVQRGIDRWADTE